MHIHDEAVIDCHAEYADLDTICEIMKQPISSVKDSTPISAGMARVVSSFRKQAATDLNMVNTVMQYKAGSSYAALVNKIYTESTENRNELLGVLGKHTLEVASGAETRQAAIRNCIKEFSQKGIPAFVDRAGREWSPEAYISMDIRTTVGNTANAAQDACCDKYGIDLFEVSSHMGARPKCAPYQGKLISRSNRSGIAHDGDGNEIPYIPLSSTSYGEPDGLFGIHCGHNKYPFIDGVNFQTYFPYDEEENKARCEEFKQQRYLERRVRDSTREVDMMKEQNDPEGLKAAKERLKQRREEYSQYSKDHELHEHNDRASVARVRKGDDVFGKIYTNPLDNGGGKGYNKSGSDIVALENQRYGRNKSTIVNKSYIDSGEYRRKFDNATDNPAVNKTLYDCAKKALKHRSGTLFEDMYWIDGDSGEIIFSVTDSTVERGIVYTDKIKEAIKNAKNIITLHTHPSSMPPSASDLNSNFDYNYNTGFAACHNGKIYAYKSEEAINKKVYDLYINSFISQGYTEFDAQIEALKKLQNNFKINFWEVTGNE